MNNFSMQTYLWVCRVYNNFVYWYTNSQIFEFNALIFWPARGGIIYLAISRISQFLVTLSLNNLGFGDKWRHHYIYFQFFATVL